MRLKNILIVVKDIEKSKEVLEHEKEIKKSYRRLYPSCFYGG